MTLGWLAIARLGLVQASLGAIVVLTTSTLNRVMVVELAWPALVPGLLVGVHHAMQLMRPRMGWGSDVGGRRTPWIVGGMAVLGLGGLLAALAVAWMGTQRMAGLALAVLAFTLVGAGVSAAGTSLLVLLAKRVDDERRAGAATLVWLMMIFGFAITAGVAGRLLDPYSPARLIAVSAGVTLLAWCVTLLSLRGVEGQAPARTQPGGPAPVRFREALREVWAEPAARRFTVFVFVSMLAFSAQDLILEPYAGSVFGWTPGQSTQLSGVQHGGILVGMLAVAAAGSAPVRRRWPRLASLRAWTVGGCLASAAALIALAVGGSRPDSWPLGLNVAVLGAVNGAFSIAAIASMMRMAGDGRARREGTRMGLWGAAQSIAFAAGGLAGTAAADLARWLVGDPARAYASVFVLEGLLFVVSAAMAWRLAAPVPSARAQHPTAIAGHAL